MSYLNKPTRTHFVLPDVQAKDGNDFTFLTCIGKYIVDKKPDVVTQRAFDSFSTSLA